MSPLRFDPNDEVEYRRRLAEGFLRDAERSFNNRDWRGTVLNSQLAAEKRCKSYYCII